MNQYRVKLQSQQRTYLWGGEQINQDAIGVSQGVPFYLTLRNDELGEPIQLGHKLLSGTEGNYGTLEPGESFTVSLGVVLAVYATPAQGDSHVECYLSESPQN